MAQNYKQRIKFTDNMKNIKLLLLDPRHKTRGVHNSYVPINIGYIAEYVKAIVKDVNLEVELSTDTDETFSLLKNWKPNIVAISNYVWNAAFSYSLCEQAKELNPNTLCILGGPEFPAGTGARTIVNNHSDPIYDKSFIYLLDRPSCDYFAFTDGEVAILELIEKFISNNFLVRAMRDPDEAIKGCASLSKDRKKLLVGNYIPRIGLYGSVKAEGRDVIPSPYLSGTLDKFLDGKSVPAFETARGCPYLCTFCDQGLDETKITTFSTKRLAEEMMYVGEKMHKIKDGTQSVSIHDSNWGLFQKDVELADHLRKVIDKYDWPQNIRCATPKANWGNLLKINDKLKNRLKADLSMQSLNQSTLKDVKRTNWTAEQYIEFTRQLHLRGKPIQSEMILCLPNESEKTFFEGVKFLMDNNVKSATYTLMMLCGAELGRDAAIKKYGMISKFRILLKQFGEYVVKKVFDMEQICVGTNTMSFESYLKCRNYNFILQLLAHPVFRPIYKLVQKTGVSWFDFSKLLADTVADSNTKGKLKNLYNDFCKESSDELFDSKEEAIKFYSKEENYKSLLKGEIGENLLAKYTSRGVQIYDDIITSVFEIIKNKLDLDYTPELNAIFDSAEEWLKNLYIIKEIYDEKENYINIEKYILKTNFDFPSWLSNTDMPFSKFVKPTSYEIQNDIKKITQIRKEMRTEQGHIDTERSANRLYMSLTAGSEVLQKNYNKII